MNTITKQTSSNFPPSFNYDTHVKELAERFSRLVKQLGSNNRKGSPRYEYEVEFAHSLNEIRVCPKYLQGKMFDKASGIVNSLVNELKIEKTDEEVATA